MTTLIQKTITIRVKPQSSSGQRAWQWC